MTTPTTKTTGEAAAEELGRQSDGKYHFSRSELIDLIDPHRTSAAEKSLTPNARRRGKVKR